jgi:queuine tRNA-ribosyltransferase
MKDSGNFSVIKTAGGSNARAGELSTAHGVIPTPVFMPVASQGTVKAIIPGEVAEAGLPMLLSNMYHLYLRPGIPVIEKMGGLHRFMGWDGAILTDSGGYQVFSLAKLRKLNDDGVIFRSHIDGSEHFITPELAVQYQESLGADVIMALDECAPHDAPYKKVEEAMHRTHNWAERCKIARGDTGQMLFGIVQGGMFPELRKQSAEYLVSLGFPGYAIGGLSIGETKETMISVLAETMKYLPENSPRYLMGVGTPEDIVEGVSLGVDMFDSALPTRVARNGALFTRAGRINIRNARFTEMDEPVETGCDCYTCRTFSAAYLHHLFIAQELLAYRLGTIHNLRFISRLVKDIREAILDGEFDSFRSKFLDGYRTTDENTRIEQKRRWMKKRG